MGIIIKAPAPNMCGDHKLLNPFAYADGAYMNKQLCRSTMAFCVFSKLGLYMAKSMKTDITCTSSTEVEIFAIVHAMKFLTWLTSFYAEFNITWDNMPQIIYEDNEACIYIMDDVGINDKTKHLKVRVWYIRERFHDSPMEIHPCNTTKMWADALTKALDSHTFPAFMTLITGQPMKSS